LDRAKTHDTIHKLALRTRTLPQSLRRCYACSHTAVGTCAQFTGRQLKSDILNEAVGSLSVTTSSDEPNNLEESSDPLHSIKAPPINMLDILLNGIGGDKTTPNDQVNTATANMLCENKMYQLLLGNDFKMKIQNIEKKVCNCPLSWWKS
jgi:hypothetical protein